MANSNATLPSQNKHTGWLWLIFAIGMSISGFAMVRHVTTSPWYRMPPKPIGDGPDYDMLALSITNSGWSSSFFGTGMRVDTSDPAWRAPYEAAARNAPESQPTYSDLLAVPTQKRLSTGRPPAFPFLVAAIYKVIGRGDMGFATVRIVLALCLAVAVGLACMLAAALTWRIEPRTPAWIPCIAAALTLLLGISNNTLKTYAEDFLTEPLALLLMQLFVLSVVYQRADCPHPSRTLWLVRGVLLGCLILCRSMFVLWLPGFFLISIAGGRGSLKRRVIGTTAMLVTTILVCLPWWIRNYRVTEGYSPLGTKGPITLLGGYCDAALEAGGEWQFGPEQELRVQLQLKNRISPFSEDEPFLAGTRFEVELAKRSSSEVAQWVRENVGSLPQLVVARIITHWNPYTTKILIWKLACIAGGLVLVLERRHEAWWLLGLPLVSTLVVAGLYAVGGRFLVPLYGILFCLPSIALAKLLPLLVPQHGND